jgi:hypothetical protein
MTLPNRPHWPGLSNLCVAVMVFAVAITGASPGLASDAKKKPAQPAVKRLLTQPAKITPIKATPDKKSPVKNDPISTDLVKKDLVKKPAAKVKPIKLRGPVRLGTAPRKRQSGQPARVGGNVKVRNLASIDAASVGSMSPVDDGFPVNMWRGISRQKLIGLIPYLPAGGASPTVRSLFRRLLLTTAVAPKGNPSDGIALLAARVRKLAEAGHLADVEALVRQIPPALAGEDLLDARLDALLLSGDTATACKLAASQVQQTPSLRWNKKMAFCHAIRGEIDRAELLESRLREQDPKDKGYFDLLAILIDPKARPLASLKRSEPLHLAMLRATQRPVPADALVHAGPAALGMFSAMEAISSHDRRRAALDAHHWGLIDGDALRFAFTVSGEKSSKLTAATPAKQKGAKTKSIVGKKRLAKTGAIAVLNQLQADALNAADDNERMAIFQKAYTWGRQAGRTRATLALFQDLLAQITPNSDHKAFAETAIRAYLLLGEQIMAAKWYQKIAQDPATEMEALRRKMAPYFILGGAKTKKYTKRGAINRWWLNEIARGGKDRFERGALIASLFDALGEPTSGALWQALYNGPTRENSLELSAALRRDLRRAAAQRRLGETVLIALIALQDDGMARLGAASLSDLVSSLRRVGLKKEAYALTSEILLVRGF